MKGLTYAEMTAEERKVALKERDKEIKKRAKKVWNKKPHCKKSQLSFSSLKDLQKIKFLYN